MTLLDTVYFNDVSENMTSNVIIMNVRALTLRVVSSLTSQYFGGSLATSFAECARPASLARKLYALEVFRLNLINTDI